MAKNSDLENRAFGCFLGQAIGDALGTRYEFKSAEYVQDLVKKDKTTDGFLPILGEGPFDLIAGQVTDDTELAMGLARSLAAKNTYDKDHAALAYKDWFRSPPFDIGNTTRNAFGSGGFTYAAICENSEKTNRDSLSNGCLMRISPLAIAGCHWPSDILRAAAKLDCRMTNPHPAAQDAVSVYVTAIQSCLLSADRRLAYDSALKAAETDIVKDLLIAAEKKPNPVNVKGKDVRGDTAMQGYLGVALQGAFYELLFAADFEQALVNTVLRGGDTDTNGCITGALAGAYFGASAIPGQWKECVLAANPKRLKSYPAVDMHDAQTLCSRLLGCTAPRFD